MNQMPGKINQKPKRRLPTNWPKYCFHYNGRLCKNIIYKDLFCKQHFNEMKIVLEQLI